MLELKCNYLLWFLKMKGSQNQLILYIYICVCMYVCKGMDEGMELRENIINFAFKNLLSK